MVNAADIALTLDDYIAQVAKYNLAINSTAERVEALKMRVNPAATLDDPFIAFGVDEIPYGETKAQAYRYQISQSFPFPGKLNARKEVAGNKAKLAEYNRKTQQREIQVIATQYFYRAFYNAQAIRLNEEMQSLVSTSMQSAKARYQSGGGDHHDWLLAKMELATLQVDEQRLQREQYSLYSAINELRGQTGNDGIETLVVKFSNNNSKDDEGSLNGQPELAALDAQAAQADSEYKMAKLEYYPDFVVQVMAMEPQMKDEMNPEESTWGVMVGISLPLYYSRKQSSLVSAAKHEKRAVEMDKTYLQNKLNTEMLNAKQALSSAKDIVRLYEQEVLPNTRSALSESRSAYASKRSSLAKYLEIVKVHKTQELEWVAANIDVELARIRLKEILSTPPLMKLAPSRPSVFGGGSMGSSMQSSEPIMMGNGMNTGTTDKADNAPQSGSNSGMSGM